MRTGNYTIAPQWLYLIIKPELAAPVLAWLMLGHGVPLSIALFPALLVTPFKVGITGNLARRFRTIKRTSPGIEIPIPVLWLPGAYYLEQFIHFIMWPFRFTWFGSGKTEWFAAGLGVYWLIVWVIINTI